MFMWVLDFRKFRFTAQILLAQSNDTKTPGRGDGTLSNLVQVQELAVVVQQVQFLTFLGLFFLSRMHGNTLQPDAWEHLAAGSLGKPCSRMLGIVLCNDISMALLL